MSVQGTSSCIVCQYGVLGSQCMSVQFTRESVYVGTVY